MFKLTLLFFLSSCSFLVEKIDTQLVTSTEIPRDNLKPSYCSTNRDIRFQLVGTNDNSQAVYLEMTKNIPPVDFLDHFALWNLMQLSIRPDQSSATSRFQVIMNVKGKSHYYDFFSEESDNQFPFLYGIEWVLKKFGKKRSLEEYANILDNFVSNKLKIGKDFENFLVKNYKEIKNNKNLSPFYLRGADILKENETSPVLNYQAVVKMYRKSQKKQNIIVNTSLSSFVNEKNSSGYCNYDFNLYNNSIFLIDKVIPVANLYGLANGESAFFASSSQHLKKLDSLDEFPLFKGQSKVRSTAVCMIENEQKKIWAFSNQSRDPGQHLFHLIKYGLPESSSISDVDTLMKHSRHLFLSDPVRLVIESKKSSKEQIENLLKLNLPIYNADDLGNIWAFTQFQKNQRFIIDARNPGAFTCQ